MPKKSGKRNIDPGKSFLQQLAQLEPAARARIVRGDPNLEEVFSVGLDLDQVFASKERERELLRRLPVGEKFRKLEEMLSAEQLLQGNRKASKTSFPPKPMGGRSTAQGVGYEVRIAAWVGAKMLAGATAVLWDGIRGDEIQKVTLQAPTIVDDVVLDLTNDRRVYISAKLRSQRISLTSKNLTFAGTIEAFVGQYLKLEATERYRARLVWAIPSSAGGEATADLRGVLGALRMADPQISYEDFIATRSLRERRVMEKFRKEVVRNWSDAEIELFLPEFLSFARSVRVEVFDFDQGSATEREAMGDLAQNVVGNPVEVSLAWRQLQQFFLTANERGITVTRGMLRRTLGEAKVALKTQIDFRRDVERLQGLTERNLSRLRAHDALPFEPDPWHVDRSEELSALHKSVESGHLLITGEPGGGKSGLIHSFAKLVKRPMVLLLAEELSGLDWKGSANLPGLEHSLDEVLARWPSADPGILITDALDAVRDPETQKRMRDLLRDVKEGESGWTVVASVREFDLQYGRELREMFPGFGAANFASDKFRDAAHFYVPKLSIKQVDDVVREHSELGPFVRAASAKSDEVHRSPFYLRLAVELLNSGTPSHVLADWTSPTALLRRFWESRVTGVQKRDESLVALGAICQKMVELRNTAVSVAEVLPGLPERRGIEELRHNGVLQAPVCANGTWVGEDNLSFTHHLLHDYAVSATLIPKVPERLIAFAKKDPELPVFYRPSFLFALEELWDSDPSRRTFWDFSLKLEETDLYGFVRILGSLVAAKRTQTFSELELLLEAVRLSKPDNQSAGYRALAHLISSLHDAADIAVRASAAGWLHFAVELSKLIAANPLVEWPLAQLLERLRKLDTPDHRLPQRRLLSEAGRAILNYHLTQPISRRRQFPAGVAIKSICQTFGENVPENKAVLFALLKPERVKEVPHQDLYDLAKSLRGLGSAGDDVVLRLFEVAFGHEPEHNEWEEGGSAIMSMRFQTKDQWNGIRHQLVEYYCKRGGGNAGLMTAVVCIVWSSVLARRRSSSEFPLLGNVQFRGKVISLFEDYSHIWGRSHEYEAGRILAHFEDLLKGWATENSDAKLEEALAYFAANNSSSLMWNVFLEMGAEFPNTLGAKIREVLHVPLFLQHPDYVRGGAKLLGALHEAGGVVQREQLEELIFTLPKKVKLREELTEEERERLFTRFQDRLLTVLKTENIVSPQVRKLKLDRTAAAAIPASLPPLGATVTSRAISDDEDAGGRDINHSDTGVREMFQLKQALQQFASSAPPPSGAEELRTRWGEIYKAEKLAASYRASQPKIAAELWSYVVGASAKFVSFCDWEKSDARWELLSSILLRASQDPDPSEEDDADRDDGHISWGWPAPRIDAAQGLPDMARKMGGAKFEIAAALRKLRDDRSLSVRYNLAVRIGQLYDVAPELMWELLKAFAGGEKRFVVLEGTIELIRRLRLRKSDEPMATRLLKDITANAIKNASAGHHIHETLACARLFHFLETGDAGDKEVIEELIRNCDSQRAKVAILPMLHCCRSGGWLTLGDGLKSDPVGDATRGRTWWFFSALLISAQGKLRAARSSLEELPPETNPESEKAKPILEQRDWTGRLVDAVATQLYFASGAYEGEKNRLTPPQLCRFWKEAASLFGMLAAETHPHTAYQLIQTFEHLLPCAPKDIFLLAAESILSSSQAGFQYESLAIGEVVKLIQRVLADYRHLFKGGPDDLRCRQALLNVLDTFVEAGWAEARQLTHRLEEIYR